MPFIPHTDQDIQAMLDSMGQRSVMDLFDEIPSELNASKRTHIPDPLDEQTLTRLMTERQSNLTPGSCFIGAGAYDHYIPAAVWELTRRGEFYTTYTPYQAEASQGSLQVIYEFQSAMTELMAMEISNASLYDGSSALAEAVLMAVRLKRGKKTRVLVPTHIHPHYRTVLHTLTKHQAIELVDIPYNAATGTLDTETFHTYFDDNTAACIIPQPNFLGTLEPVDELTKIAHQREALVIAQVNPLAMTWLQPPGEWGDTGADIACGEGQPLGVPLSIGGPYFGFLCCRTSDARQMPGRIVGRTIDSNQTPCYTLTLQAREQHIRRSKATSNICTNQGLVVTAATIFMRLMGASGLLQTAQTCHQRAQQLQTLLHQHPDIEPVFTAPFFNEFVIRFPKHRCHDILNTLRKHGIQGGYDLSQTHPELGQALLVCATEVNTDSDIERYQQCLQQDLS